MVFQPSFRSRHSEHVVQACESIGLALCSCQPADGGRGDHLKFVGGTGVIVYGSGRLSVVGKRKELVQSALVDAGVHQSFSRRGNPLVELPAGSLTDMLVELLRDVRSVRPPHQQVSSEWVARQVGRLNDLLASRALVPSSLRTEVKLDYALQSPDHVRVLKAVGQYCEAALGLLAMSDHRSVARARHAHGLSAHRLDPSLVFVVHGRDSEQRDSFFALIRALGLHPIEWGEAVAITGKGTPYVGEVLDGAFQVAQAIVILLTPDDQVRLRPELCRPNDPPVEVGWSYQARPNVIFEAGMAFGAQPERTILVEVGASKLFSDIAGRHTVRLSDNPETRNALAERLRIAGCAVNTKGTDWLNVGKFSLSST